MKKFAHHAITLILLAMIAFQLAGCNTVDGMGKDIEATGEWIQGNGDQHVRRQEIIMSRKSIPLTILAVCCILSFSACDRDKENGKTTDKQSVVQKAESGYNEMEKQTQDLITQMKEYEKPELETQADQLQDKLNQAKQKFTELQQTDQKNLKQLRQDFNNAMDELSQSYEEAQAKMNNNK